MTTYRKVLCLHCYRTLPPNEIAAKEYVCTDCTKQIVRQVGALGPIAIVAVNALVIAISIDTGKLICVSSTHDNVHHDAILSVTGWAVLEAKKIAKRRAADKDKLEHIKHPFVALTIKKVA